MKRICNMVFCLSILLILLAGCGQVDMESQLTGAWYMPGDDSPVLILLEDGSYQKKGDDTGTWKIVHEKWIELSDSHGMQTASIISLENGCLTLGFENAGILVLWDTEKAAMTATT